jgi:hypothetical protein
MIIGVAARCRLQIRDTAGFRHGARAGCAQSFQIRIFLLTGALLSILLPQSSICEPQINFENETNIETPEKPAIRRGGVSAERRRLLEIEGFGFRPGVFIGYSPEGFLPKAATLFLQRSQTMMCQF